MIFAPRYIPRIAATVGLFTRYGLLDFAKRQGLTSIEGLGATDGQGGAGKEGADEKEKAVAFRERLVELGPADLPAAVDPCGERGEFHTFVSDGPGFSSPISYGVGATVFRDERFMYCDLK